MSRAQFPVRAAMGLLLVVPLGCRLDRKTELLDNQYLVARVDNSSASQQHLEEELRRELSHVEELEFEIDDLVAREEELATEMYDASLRVEEGYAELAALEEEAHQIATEAALERERQEQEKKGLDDLAASRDRAKIEARLAELTLEVDKLKGALDRLTPPPEPAPVPAEAAVPPKEGG